MRKRILWQSLETTPTHKLFMRNQSFGNTNYAKKGHRKFWCPLNCCGKKL